MANSLVNRPSSDRSVLTVASNLIDDALAAKASGFLPTPHLLPDKSRPRRAAPFSLRLTLDERARLTQEAAGAPLGSYIKAKVLGSTVPLRARRTGLAVEDRKALAQALALLGSTRLSSHLGDMAMLAATGSLPLTPETQAELAACIADVRALRALLVHALGLQAETAP